MKIKKKYLNLINLNEKLRILVLIKFYLKKT